MEAVVCELCLRGGAGTQCDQCGADSSSVAYKIGQFVPPVALAFATGAACRVGVSFIPDPGFEQIGLALAGSVAALTAVHAVGSTSLWKRLGVGLLVSFIVSAAYALEIHLGSSGLVAPEGLLVLVGTYGGGMLLGIACGWPLSALAAELPPFSSINRLTERIPYRRVRLLVRVFVQVIIVSVILALVAALLVIALALLAAYVVCWILWLVLRDYAYEEWNIGKSPEQREHEAQQKKAERARRGGGAGRHYDKHGSKTGYTDEHGNHYDKHGSKTGYTDEHGNHYDKYGSKTGHTDEHGTAYDEYGGKRGYTEGDP